MEGHDGVRRIAEEQHVAAVVPVTATHGPEHAQRMIEHIVDEVADQWPHVGKVLVEERDYGRLVG